MTHNMSKTKHHTSLVSGTTWSDSSWRQKDFIKFFALITVTSWLGLYTSKIRHHNSSWNNTFLIFPIINSFLINTLLIHSLLMTHNIIFQKLKPPNIANCTWTCSRPNLSPSLICLILCANTHIEKTPLFVHNHFNY